MTRSLKDPSLDVRGFDANKPTRVTRKGQPPKVKKPSAAKMKRLYELRKVVPC